MKKFAQIVENKVHWIFEAEEKPEFAPYIQLVEITGRDDVKEGWYYNEGNFSEIDLNPTLAPEPADPEKVAMAEAIADFEARLSALENK